MKKILLSFSILSLLLFVSCDDEIDTDVVSVTDYEFVSFQDDTFSFEVNQGDSSTHTITVYASRVSGSDRTLDLSVVPLDPNDATIGTNIASNLYTVPASVTIPANQSSAEFDVTITDNNLASGSRLVLDFADSVTAASPHPIVMNVTIVCPVNELIIDITFDQYAEETSWELYDLNGPAPVLVDSGDGYDDLDSTSIQVRSCIESGNFGFVIYDAYSDGICCAFGQGSYTLTLNGQQIATGGQFGANDVVTFSAP